MAQQGERLWGECVDLRLSGTRLLTGLLLAVTVTGFGFLATGEYSRREAVAGMLVSDKGAVQVRAPADGIVEVLLVGQGDRVGKGDTLLVIGAGSGAATNDRLLAENARQSALLQQELTDVRETYPARQRQLEAEVISLEHRRSALEALLANAAGTMSLNLQNLERLRRMQDRGLAADADLDNAEAGRLDAERTLSRVRLELEENGYALVRARHGLEQLQPDFRRQVAGLEKALSELRKQDLHLHAEQNRTIVSPVDGTVSVVFLHQGQSVQARQTLVSVLQSGSRLQAELFVPSRAIGFVRPGQPVSLRLDAFPYQKFGLQTAWVDDISRNVVLPSDNRDGVAGNEPVYRITAALDRQALTAYGNTWPLRPGMQFRADILLESRSLLEWLLEPLLARTGKG